MHPIVIRSLGLAMIGLSVALLGFALFFGLKFGNPLGIVVTAVFVAIGGYALTNAADKQAR